MNSVMPEGADMTAALSLGLVRALQRSSRQHALLVTSQRLEVCKVSFAGS